MDHQCDSDVYRDRLDRSKMTIPIVTKARANHQLTRQ